MSDFEVDDLIARVEQGDKEALDHFIDEYGKYVYRAVRKSLSNRLRQLMDSDDLAQSVWASIFEINGQIGKFENRAALIGFLTTVARRKVAYKARQHLNVQKANHNRLSLMDQAHLDGIVDADAGTPSNAVTVHEEWERVVGPLPDREREIVELRRTSHSNGQIM